MDLLIGVFPYWWREIPQACTGSDLIAIKLVACYARNIWTIGLFDVQKVFSGQNKAALAIRLARCWVAMLVYLSLKRFLVIIDIL
jgi:hypothetical protein